MPSFTAQPLRISSYCNQAPVLPAAMQPLKPETSRLLDGLEERHKQSRQLVADALSFADYGKEDRSNV